MYVLELLLRCAGWDGKWHALPEPEPQQVTVLQTYKMKLGTRSSKKLISAGKYDVCNVDVARLNRSLPGIEGEVEVHLLELHNSIQMHEESVLRGFGYKFASIEMLLIWGAMSPSKEIRAVNIGGDDAYIESNPPCDKHYYIRNYYDENGEVARMIEHFYPYTSSGGSYGTRCYLNKYVLAVRI